MHMHTNYATARPCTKRGAEGFAFLDLAGSSRVATLTPFSRLFRPFRAVKQEEIREIHSKCPSFSLMFPLFPRRVRGEGRWTSRVKVDRNIRGTGVLSKTQEFANCDEFAPPYREKIWYRGANSSQLVQLLGFGYDPPSSYLAIKIYALKGCQKKILATPH